MFHNTTHVIAPDDGILSIGIMYELRGWPGPSRDRADMDVLVASSGNHYTLWVPTDNTVRQQ